MHLNAAITSVFKRSEEEKIPNHTDAALTHLCINVFISLPSRSQMKINDTKTEKKKIMLQSKPTSLQWSVCLCVKHGREE